MLKADCRSGEKPDSTRLNLNLVPLHECVSLASNVSDDWITRHVSMVCRESERHAGGGSGYSVAGFPPIALYCTSPLAHPEKPMLMHPL